MLRSFIRFHTVVLAIASAALLLFPGAVLETFGVHGAGFEVLALTRVLAGVLALLAATLLPLPDLPTPVRGRALVGVAAAYMVVASLVLAQQVAIWANVAGAVLTAECVLHAAVFAWLAHVESAPRVATA